MSTQNLPFDPPVEVQTGQQYVVGIDMNGQPFATPVQHAVLTSFSAAGTLHSVLLQGLPLGAQAVDYRYGMDT
jgi:hypothetical protein